MKAEIPKLIPGIFSPFRGLNSPPTKISQTTSRSIIFLTTNSILPSFKYNLSPGLTHSINLEKLNLDDAAEVMKLKYPNGRNIDFVKDRARYNVSGFPYNNVFYDPTTYAESLFDFSKYQH